jgi:hypothetical protein
MGVFAAFAAIGFAAAYVGPMGSALTVANAEENGAVSLYASSIGDVQTLVVDEGRMPTPNLARSIAAVTRST